MHPRIVMLALTGVALDLLSLAAAGTLLLLNNPWFDAIGPARFWFVVAMAGGSLVPIMYGVERDGVARRIGDKPEGVGASLPAWSGETRSERVA
jgi:hypothetical protein